MKKYSREEKQRWLEDWSRSGKSAWVYAREQGIVPQTFGRWRRESIGTPRQFVEIKAVPPRREGEILIERGEIKIHLPAGTKDMAAVLSALGGLA